MNIVSLSNGSWVIFIIILSVTLWWGIKYKKNLYRIIGLNLLFLLLFPIGFFIFQSRRIPSMDDDEKIPIGTIDTIKGMLVFNELVLKDTTLYYVTPVDSVSEKKIERCDSSFFSVSVSHKFEKRNYSFELSLKTTKEELRKLRDLDFLKLQRDSMTVEVTFVGKKIERYFWDCQQILKVELIKGEPTLLLH